MVNIYANSHKAFDLVFKCFITKNSQMTKVDLAARVFYFPYILTKGEKAELEPFEIHFNVALENDRENKLDGKKE